MRKDIRYMIKILALIGLLAMTNGCIPGLSSPDVSMIDTPVHHYNNGEHFLNLGMYQEALSEFSRAKTLDPNYVQAYVGSSLVFANMREYKKAFEEMNRAKKINGVISRVGMIRLHLYERGEGWLEKAELEFVEGQKLNPGYSPLYYFMGKSYKLSLKFDDASKMFLKVVDLKKEFVIEASEEWSNLQKIIRVQPKTEIGKRIGILDRIDRADIAALLKNESELIKMAPPGFKQQMDIKIMDISGNVFKDDIEEIVRYQIKGLLLFEGNMFRPYEPITKGDISIIAENILTKYSKIPELQQRLTTNISPFPDIKDGHFVLPAVIFVTSRGIVNPNLNGNFGIDDKISGGDALVIIKRLNEDLIKYKK